MRDDEALHHPKLVELREIVNKQMQSGQSKTVLLVRSSLIFESAAKALHGVCNEVTLAPSQTWCAIKRCDIHSHSLRHEIGHLCHAEKRNENFL